MIIPVETERLLCDLTDARDRTLEVVKGLGAGRLVGPRLDIVNPILWEIGHIAWFHEYFVLRRLDGGEPRLIGADSIYNSSTVPHEVRWELPLPSLTATLDYLDRVREAMVSRLTARPADAEAIALAKLAILHEDMHGEVLTYTRQTLGYPPRISPRPERVSHEQITRSDLQRRAHQRLPAPKGRGQEQAKPGALQRGKARATRPWSTVRGREMRTSRAGLSCWARRPVPSSFSITKNGPIRSLSRRSTLPAPR